MKNPFDVKIDRRGTNSVKWEFIHREGSTHELDQTERFFGENPTLPMWVADMDFRCPEPVVKALVARAKNGIYGYSAPGEEFYRAVVNWMARRHGWEIEPEWIVITPGVVPALNMLVRTFIAPGDGVVIQPPVYHPFPHAIGNNGGRVVTNPLIYANGRYRMDFADLERKVQDPGVKMAILCNPHNPVGRVWREDELKRFGEICLENNVLVVSDEIHGDLIYQGNKFTPFTKISRDFSDHFIACSAPSKTFNLAGLQTSCIIIADADLRARFQKTLGSLGLGLTNSFGIVALQTAYDQGEEWLEQALAYLQGNLEYLETYVAGHIPQIDVVRPEGTYLVWLDCRRLGLDKLALQRLMMEGARVFLDDGFIFGTEGEGFERINIACPRSVLAEALERISQAIAGLQK